MGQARLEIREDCSGKPDPSEPWRYVCPDCERQVHRKRSGYIYRCSHCKKSFKKSQLKDKKSKRLR